MANRYVTVLASAARTALVVVPIRQVSSDTPKVLVFTLDVTLDAASAIITPRIEGYDPLSDGWTTILQGAAVNSVSKVLYKIGIGLTAVANLTVNHEIPTEFRLNMAVNDTDAMTYSVGLEIINS